MKFNTPFLIAILTVGLTGCALTPEPKSPHVESHQNWSAPQSVDSYQAPSSQPLEEWWKQFDDPLLNQFIQAAVRFNHDIELARNNVLLARAMRKVEASGKNPTFNQNSEIAGIISSEEGFSPAGRIPAIERENEFLSTEFSANWELDVFGRIEHAIEAADARLRGAVELRRDMTLLVVAEVAHNYFELRGIQRELAITEKNIELQQQTYDLVEQQFQHEIASEFDLSRSKAQLQFTQSRLPNLRSAIRTLAHRISVLTGRSPQTLVQELNQSKPLPVSPDIVPVGLPSELLQRRPDLRLAREEIAAASQDLAKAVADQYPRFHLTGTAGLESISFGDFLDSNSGFLSLGPSVHWPIFQGGRLRALVEANHAVQRNAVINYERTYLQALEEVENALIQYGEELNTQSKLQNTLQSRQRSVRLANQRYDEGISDLLDVLDTERELLQTEIEYVRSLTECLTDVIALYKALGGGWEPFESLPDNLANRSYTNNEF